MGNVLKVLCKRFIKFRSEPERRSVFSGWSSGAGFFPLSNPASLLDHHSVCYFLFTKKFSLSCYIFQDSQFEHLSPQNY